MNGVYRMLSAMPETGRKGDESARDARPQRGGRRVAAIATVVAMLGAGMAVAVAPPASAVPSCDSFDSLLQGSTTGLMSCDASAAGTYTVTVTGAGGGGAGGSSASTGGDGAVTTYTVTVTAGQTLSLEVGTGGTGGNSGPDGGGGGGWSAVKDGASILIVAGGGGGAGSRDSGSNYPIGSSIAGGDAGAVGVVGDPTPSVGADNVGGGAGATALAGGTGGSGGSEAGAAGSAGIGGGAGGACSFGGAGGGNTWNGGGRGSASCGATGGGGGAGYFGGGGGGAAYGAAKFGAGGGGGSSYPVSASFAVAANGGASATSGGDGRILFTALAPPTPPTPTPGGGGGSSTPTTVTIGLDSNGGQGSVPALSGDAGTWVSAPGSGGLSRLGYVFAGWNTASNGSGMSFAAGAALQLTGDNTLFAQWTSITALDPIAGGVTTPVAGAGEELPIALDQPMRAGQSLLTVAGLPVPVTVRPNASADPVALVVSAPSLSPALTMRLEGRGDVSDPLGLTSKQALVLQSQVVERSTRAVTAKVQPVAKSSGDGFKADSSVKFFILPSTYLGSLMTDGSGAYDGSLAIPAGVMPGVYTMQANGLAPNGDVRSLSIGVLMKPTSVSVKTASASARVYFAAMSSALSDQAKSTLRALAKQTGSDASRTVAVGFVQPTANTTNDVSLSTARAKNVSAFLKGLGLKGLFVVRGDGVATQTGSSARRVNVTVTDSR